MADLENAESVLSLLHWDTLFFGFPVARLNSSEADGPLMNMAEQWCQKRGVRCLYWLADPSSSAVVNTAFDYHFKFADLRLKLHCSLNLGIDCDDPCLRPAGPGDISTLRQIAGLAHRDSRFFTDSKFPAGSGERLFGDWIERDVLSEEEKVWVYAGPGNIPEGYASCRLQPSSPINGEIGLIAVSSEARGRGIGQRLLRQCHRWLALAGATNVCVVTQGANLAAQRMYIRSGYFPVRSDYWFHRWFY